MRMTFSVAVAGATGYAGGEVLRLLAGHPDAQVSTLTGASNAGQLLTAIHPHLMAWPDAVIQPTDVARLAGHDVIILALPHGKSGELAAQLAAASPQSILVDLGADHRLVDPVEWERYYGGEHPGTWTYGMPELLTGWGTTPPKQRHQLQGTRRIAVPGCNVTAVTLALAPGIASGLLDPKDLTAVLACGVSGAGKAPKPHLLASEILGDASPYAVGGSHRHIPEILQNLQAGLAGNEPSISFTPTLVPMSRGILATCTAKPGPAFSPDHLDPDHLRRPWELAYGDEPFVHLLPQGQWPRTAQTTGANTAVIQLAWDDRAGRVVVIAAIDNLVKGTAGAALQSINLALGLPEVTGLTQNGVAP